jgi:hypothetical protein
MNDADEKSRAEKLVARSFKLEELRALFEQEQFRTVIAKMATTADAQEVVEAGRKLLSEIQVIEGAEISKHAVAADPTDAEAITSGPDKVLEILAKRRETLNKVRADLNKVDEIQASMRGDERGK